MAWQLDVFRRRGVAARARVWKINIMGAGNEKSRRSMSIGLEVNQVTARKRSTPLTGGQPYSGTILMWKNNLLRLTL